jgi:hypothetical protein
MKSNQNNLANINNNDNIILIDLIISDGNVAKLLD